MAIDNFKTEDRTFDELLNRYGIVYKIPVFQRDYSWTLTQWDDLWSDIVDTLNVKAKDNPNHYMGYLVLKKDSTSEFSIIDGQQRITTIEIIVLAILANLKKLIDADIDKENNLFRFKTLQQTFIGNLDPVTLHSDAKLILNRNNKIYFSLYLIPLRKLPVNGYSASELLLREAFNYFSEKISCYLKKEKNDKGVALFTLCQEICNKLFFTVITLDNELNAFKVFETLNARGLQLSETDLVKNYIFNFLADDFNKYEINELDTRWNKIVGKLGNCSLLTYLRAFWNSKYSFVRKNQLYKTIKDKISNKAQVYELIQELEENIDNYIKLIYPNNSYFDGNDQKQACTLRLFNVTTPYSLLLAAQSKLSSKDFSTLLKIIVVISFRYNVICELSCLDQEKIYNKIALKITNGEVTNLQELLPLLKKLYIKDKIFRDTFENKTFNTNDRKVNRLVKYILTTIEKDLSGIDLALDSPDYNIEHIYPQNPGSDEDWPEFIDDYINISTYKLGNLTLLSEKDNREIGNKAFSQKVKVYAKCKFEVTKYIAEHYFVEWSPAIICSRQHFLVSEAVKIWKVSQLATK